MADFSLSQALSHTSDEDDDDQHSPPPHQTLITPVVLCPTTTLPSSSSSRPRTNITHIVQTTPSSTPDTTRRKPRGRPPGSRNKPKPPIYITRESEPASKTGQLEIPSGLDIVEMVRKFATKNHVGVNIISGFGSISNVVLKYPGVQGQSMSLSGTFELLSVSGTFMSPSVVCTGSKENKNNDEDDDDDYSSGSHYLAVFLAGNGAQVFGGVVMGKVMAASNVVLNVSTFGNYEFHRLCPGDDGVESKFKPNGGGGCGPCQSSNTPASSHVPEVLNWAPPAPDRSPHY